MEKRRGRKSNPKARKQGNSSKHSPFSQFHQGLLSGGVSRGDVSRGGFSEGGVSRGGVSQGGGVFKFYPTGKSSKFSKSGCCPNIQFKGIITTASFDGRIQKLRGINIMLQIRLTKIQEQFIIFILRPTYRLYLIQLTIILNNPPTLMLVMLRITERRKEGRKEYFNLEQINSLIFQRSY